MRRVLLMLLAGCASNAPASSLGGEFPADEGGGKEDAFGRALAGVAQPYHADPALSEQEERLRTDAAFRREVAWEIVARTVDPVPLLGLADRAAEEERVALPNGEVPEVPRFQTWYGVDDFKRMFQSLYEGMDRADRLARTAFTPEQIAEAEQLNATTVDRSSRWPLERFLRYVDRLGICEEGLSEDECARRLGSNFSGAAGGNARITYAPATVTHLLENYGAILECMESLDELAMDAAPTEEANFTRCFESEMPEDAVLVKAQWVRADFEMDMPVFDTHAEALAAVLGPDVTGTWSEEGDRRASPGDDEIVTIRLRNGSTYRLAGLHIMTKELRHWMWISLWWSDTPESDFGADRPAVMEALGPQWGRYKMCVVVDYQEGDAEPAARFGEHPTLAAALAALPEGATWCSNPYLEHGRGNARTNCIGCHQHGGSTVGHDLDGDGLGDAFDLERVIDDPERFPRNGRTQIREVFPADYLWSFSRVDNLSQVIASEVSRLDVTDGRALEARVERLVERLGEGDEAQGAAVFGERCARCHGPEGLGDFGPNLYERVSMRDDETLVRRLLLGLGPMPSWDAELTDQELTDVLTFLRATFGDPEA